MPFRKPLGVEPLYLFEAEIFLYANLTCRDCMRHLDLESGPDD